jgi:hypothetical protein
MTSPHDKPTAPSTTSSPAVASVAHQIIEAFLSSLADDEGYAGIAQKLRAAIFEDKPTEAKLRAALFGEEEL